MRKLLVILAVLAATVPLAGYFGFIYRSGAGSVDDGDSPEARADPQVFVATIHPLADLTRQLVGDAARVTAMLSPGDSPHHFEPTARQMSRLSQARLIVCVGLGLDGWVTDAARAAGRGDLPVFKAGDALGLEGHAGHCAHHDHGHHHHHGHHHDHGQVDPHIWLDPVLMKTVVQQLAAQLGELAPEHAATIDRNLVALVGELEQLDRHLTEQLQPHRGRKIVTYHSAFNRFAERYGLEVADTLMPIEAAGGDSMAALSESMDTIRAHDLKVIFTEPQFPDDAARMLQRETGVKVMMLDPLGDPASADRATYQQLMRYNLDVIIRGLSLP